MGKNFLAALLIIAKNLKHPKWLSVEYVNKLCLIHTMEYYTAMEKNKLLPNVAI